MDEANERFEIRLSGAGGQGIVLAGIILGEAASIYGDKHALQTQSYGPEARGGTSKSEVIICDGEVDYPKVIKPHLLLAMNPPAYRKYGPDVREDGIIIADSSHDFEAADFPARTIPIPIGEISKEVTGRTISANAVALGIICAVTGIVSMEALEKSLAKRVPPHTRMANKDALHAGFEAGKKAM